MEHGKSQLRRCAIYTRKSSEEGLEQDLNSLHAQREACEAFVKSQAGEGWRLVKTAYDDGGFSGGTMERPALQRVLADIRERLIDVVVVYKVEAHPLAGRLRQNGRVVRCALCVICIYHPAVQHHDPDGTVDAQRVAVVRAVRAGGHGKAMDRELWEAHRWFEELASGRATSLAAIGSREGVTDRYVARLIRLAFVAPKIVAAIAERGKLADLKLTPHVDLPLDWTSQKRAVGIE